MDREIYDNFVTILREELVPALGCTEPIAVAYAAAKARAVLGTMPERMRVFCSGNIVKNVKSVTVPNSNGLQGIDAAAILGAIGGNADRELEVLSEVSEEDIQQTRKLLKASFCKIELATNVDKLFVRVEGSRGTDTVSVTIQGHHTNITDIVKNGEILYHFDFTGESSAVRHGDRSALSVRRILQFADEAAMEDVAPILERQIQCNTRISQEGMDHRYGAGVARAVLSVEGNSVFSVAAAKAAAASEARMSGCALPVVINSGSGNQGITVSVPVIEYARAEHFSEERLLRALAVSNLISIHLKHFIGDLSAFCGAVTAACGVGAALAYLNDCGYGGVADTITNTLAAVSGMFCDGAKPSCASKVASALDATFVGFRMAQQHRVFGVGEGVVGEDVEQTIRSVGYIGREGMDETDHEILKVMLSAYQPSREC